MQHRVADIQKEVSNPVGRISLTYGATGSIITPSETYLFYIYVVFDRRTFRNGSVPYVISILRITRITDIREDFLWFNLCGAGLRRKFYSQIPFLFP